MKYLFSAFLLVLLYSCSASKPSAITSNREGVAVKSKVAIRNNVPARVIDTKQVPAEKVVSFAETLQGTPYKYGSIVKEKGFDCSGFVYYVFSHYKISVPRVSKDFTNAGREISTLDSKRGDIILFTGSDVNSGEVGHMGIITRNDKGVLQFIHAASGKGGGVTISTMNSYFVPRFVKVIRVFNNI
jgi:cell wall-associated NlpC family hydrolase